MTIHKVIREARQRLGLSEVQFAQRVSEELGTPVTRATIQHWERENGTAPNRKKQAAVAKVLGLSVAQQMSGDLNTAAGPEIRGAVPLLSDVQSGNYKMHVDNFHPGDGGAEPVPTSVPVKQYTFALRVTGDSMAPEFMPGAVVIVEPEMEPQPGDYVIAKNAEGETTFKQLVRDGGEWFLKPVNPQWPMKALGNGQIVGVVRAVEKRFR